MKNYSSKRAKRGKTAYRTPSRFLNCQPKKIAECKVKEKRFKGS
jgi:hypothetical protein